MRPRLDFALAALVAFAGCGGTTAGPGSRPIASLTRDQLRAPDLVGLGDRILADGGSPALAWGAFEAARRLDPAAESARSGLARAEALRGDRDVPLIDRFEAVADPRSLGSLIVRLVVHSPSLDELARIPRPEFARPDPDDAPRLVAHLLLQEGRAEEALRALEGAGSPAASWLASRALLQLGRDEEADEALARAHAGGFHADARDLGEPAPYVGSAACRACHGAIARTQTASRHARTRRDRDGLGDVPIPTGPLVDPGDPSVIHEIVRSGQGIMAKVRCPDGQMRSATIAHAVGSGAHGMTLLGRDEGGTWRELRMSFYRPARGPTLWDITGGFPPRPADLGEWLGRPQDAAGVHACLDCHSTRSRDAVGPESADAGIGCERCHGPGGNHLRAVASGFAESALIATTRERPGHRSAACMACHAAAPGFPDSDPEFVRFQASTLPKSRCVMASGGALDCASCHDPHSDADSAPAKSEARCASCHRAGSPSTCKVDATSGCVGCHMPRVEVPRLHTSYTDHWIRVHR